MADRRLQVFYTVARQLSFTKAAEQLFMTQPAVTFQVKQLEEHYNTRLFERSHGRIALTAAGSLVMGYAERILGLTQELETRVGELTGAVSGPLLLGASTTIAEVILPQVLGEFKALHPQVQAYMTVGNSETIEHRVADHTLDLGLIESPSHLPSLHTEVCCEDELVMICAPAHRLARLMSVTPQQIAGEPYVSRESGSGTREFAASTSGRAGRAEDLTSSWTGRRHQGRGRNRRRRSGHVARAGGEGAETRRAGRDTTRAAAHPDVVAGAPEGQVPLEAAHHFRGIRHRPHAADCRGGMSRFPASFIVG